MEFKGTRGKFEVVEHSWYDTSLYCGDYCIATKSIYDEATEENQEELELEVSHNFKLLSKAPEMLEMLKESLDTFTCNDSSDRDLKSRIEQLIDEATNI